MPLAARSANHWESRLNGKQAWQAWEKCLCAVWHRDRDMTLHKGSDVTPGMLSASVWLYSDADIVWCLVFCLRHTQLDGHFALFSPSPFIVKSLITQSNQNTHLHTDYDMITKVLAMKLNLIIPDYAHLHNKDANRF